MLPSTFKQLLLAPPFKGEAATKGDRGSPAAIHALRPEDTILSMGRPADQFIAEIRSAPPGSIISIIVLAKGKKERMTHHVPPTSGPGDKVRDDEMQAD